MPQIRPYRSTDLEALYKVCLLTGEAGKDATALYQDPKLLGYVYAAPYGIFSPDTAFIAEDEKGNVAGYIVGPADTRTFDARLEAQWWPSLRPSLHDPSGHSYETWSRDDRMRFLIHHPAKTPSRILDRYPSHLHINLLPSLQGKGLGKRMIDRWLATMREKGSPGAHLGVGTANPRAIRFYRAYGFHEIEASPRGVIWFGMLLA